MIHIAPELDRRAVGMNIQGSGCHRHELVCYCVVQYPEMRKAYTRRQSVVLRGATEVQETWSILGTRRTGTVLRGVLFPVLGCGRAPEDTSPIYCSPIYHCYSLCLLSEPCLVCYA